ncbi:sensory box protein, partial [Vibrio parahaemolyticus V-223/04]
VATRPA